MLQISSNKAYGFRSALFNTGGTANFGIAADFPDLLSYNIQFNQLGDVASTRVINMRVENTDSIDQDAATMLGQVDSISLDATDPLRPVINYTGPTGDASVGVFAYGEDEARVTWIVMHPGALSVQLPALPGGLADRWMPPSLADIEIAVDVFDNSESRNYADVRQTGSPLGDFEFSGPGSRTERSSSFPVPPQAAPAPDLFQRHTRHLDRILRR